MEIQVKNYRAEIQYTYVNVWCLSEMYVPMQQHCVVCFAFHATFSGSFNTVFMLDWFTPGLMQHFILMTLFRMLEL